MHNKYLPFPFIIAAVAVCSTALAQSNYTIDMRIEPGSIPLESEEWRQAFSVDPAETRNTAPPQVNLDGATKLAVTYKGKMAGFNIGRIFITADITDTTYEMGYKVETEGMARWLDQTEQSVISYGLLNHTDMTSLYYFRDELEKDFQQKVELTRAGPGERFRYWSNPKIELYHPVMPEIGLNTVDSLGGLAQLGFVAEEEGKEPCDRVVNVYDGRRRFDMRMEPSGTATLKKRGKSRYEGFTYKCKVTMEKVAGYNQKNMAQDFDGNAYVYLAPVPTEVRTKNISYLPVLLEGKSGMVKATLEAKEPIFTLADGTVIDMSK